MLIRFSTHRVYKREGQPVGENLFILADAVGPVDGSGFGGRVPLSGAGGERPGPLRLV